LESNEIIVKLMDSQLQREGRLILFRTKEWCEDMCSLPNEEISVPLIQLPDPEPDNGNPLETLKDLELKWNDLALNRILYNQQNHYFNNIHINNNQFNQ